jgi:zinc transport system substrate-binding protein
MNMVKKLIAFFSAITVVLALAACGTRQNGASDGKIKVSVSFNALHEFVQAVGGDRVSISTVIPDGTEPHDFEPKAQDLAALNEADLFIVNGLGMESWAEDAVKASENTDLIVVDASAGVDTINTEEEHQDEQSEAGADEEEHHAHGAYDPHIWLSPVCAVKMAENIKAALQKADPDNSTYYDTNYTAFTGKLNSLFADFSEKFKTSENKSFVTGHAAFAYLCRDFGLLQNSVEDVFAEGEPTAQQLAALVEYCRTNHVTTIFSEALVSADISETLAREVGAEVKPIYTMASTENGKTYLERMEENLDVIYKSLK